MTVVGFIASPSDAAPVVTWAGRLAAASNTDLVLFYVPSSDSLEGATLDAQGQEQYSDSTHKAVTAAVEGIVRTKRARKGRLPRHLVSLRRVTDPSPVTGVLSRARAESPELFVAAVADGQPNGKCAAKQIAAKLACNYLLLRSGKEAKHKTNQVLVAASDGAHDRNTIAMGAAASRVVGKGATLLGVEVTSGASAVQVGERQLRKTLRELELEESSRLKINVQSNENWAEAVSQQAAECDLLLIGADVEKSAPQIVEENPHVTVGVLRRAPRVAFAHRKQNQTLLPQVNPADYADLYEQLQAGSRWNSDFIVMLSLAAGIATLGLLQSSPAVVIGSMLLAPLMTPMIGMGLALNQGNPKLAYASFRAIGRGFLMALLISALVGWITPGSDLTPEVLARTEPNILDLLIAVFSGAAAAYALARPSLAGTIAGVAIATALVPPLCSTGISLAYAQFPEAIGALSLLVVNVLAIILAAAATFRAMGLGALALASKKQTWVRRVVAGLTVCVLVMAVPLVSTFLRQAKEGKNTPFALGITDDVRSELRDHVKNKMPGVKLIFAGRSAVHREEDPVDVGIVLSSPYPLPRSAEGIIQQLIRDAMDNPELMVDVECIAGGWAEETPAMASAVAED